MDTAALIVNLQTQIDALTTATSKEALLNLAIAIDNATTHRYSFVASTGDLPLASSVANGYMVYVDSIGVLAVANGGNWIGLDGKPVGKQTLLTWGGNTYGELGDGTTTARSSPGTVAGGGTTWSQISVGEDETAAVKSDGTLWTWGRNNWGQLGIGNTTDRSSPGTVAGGGTTWKQVSIGSGQVVAAVKTDGTLWTWGNNANGQLGDGTTTSRSSPGTVAGGGTNWVQVSASRSRAVAAIKTDGTLWTWGDNTSGQLGTGNTTSRSSPGTTAGGGTNWAQVSVGGFFMAAVKSDGTLWTWGSDSFARLGDGQFGAQDRSSPGTTSGGGTTWSQVGAGYKHCSAVKTDGTLWSWGNNASGQLGTNDATFALDITSPKSISGGGTTWRQVSSGYDTGAAAKTDGTLWAWGNNASGQLGTGNTTNRSSPVSVVGGITTWIEVANGSGHMAGLRL